MKKIALLWLACFILSAISIGCTYSWVISPIWVVNIVMAHYLIQLRHEVNHPLFSVLFSFSVVFTASWLFDPVKDLQTKALLSLIGSLQVLAFIYSYYWLIVKALKSNYLQTILIAVPNIVSACVGGLLFMLIFDFGVNYYEFLDYFLEQFVTGLSIMCVLHGVGHWKNIPLKDYGWIVIAWFLQYVISTDPIFYACFIFPFLMCYFALKYNLKEISLLIGLLTFVCSVFVSIPLAGEFWSADDTPMLSRLSSYRLALGCYLIIFLFVCEIYLNNKRLSSSYERMMFCDELTGLKNRRFVREKILSDKNIKDGYLLLIDIDNFKKVNDVHGHYVGDLVIKHITTILSQLKLKQNINIRWGGEEFLVLVPNATVEQCREICDVILAACEKQAFVYKDCQIDATVSIGATTFDQFAEVSYAHWIQEADQCLYQAKALGKKQYVLRD